MTICDECDGYGCEVCGGSGKRELTFEEQQAEDESTMRAQYDE